MTSNRFSPKFAPIRYDPAGIYIGGAGLSRVDQIRLTPRLEAARREVLGELEQRPESAFIELPERLLAEYQKTRRASELGRILAAGKRLRDSVDRVVVLWGERLQVGARSLFEACCHPYHNELSRGERGGRPRIYFINGEADNDALQGLLDLLGNGRPAATVDDRWALIVMGDGGQSAEFAAVMQILLDADKGVGSRFSPEVDGIATDEKRLPTPFYCSLLPGAVLGLDVVRFLEGAAAMTQRFRDDPPGDNPVLDHAGASHLLATLRGSTDRVLKVTGRGLDSLCEWYARDLPSPLWGEGPGVRGNERVEQANTEAGEKEQRHSPSPRPTPVKGEGEKSTVTRVIVEAVRRDRLSDSTGRTLPEILTTQIQAAKQADTDAGRPTAELHLPALDEGTLGQLFQMLLLTAVVERRLELQEAARTMTNVEGRMTNK